MTTKWMECSHASIGAETWQTLCCRVGDVVSLRVKDDRKVKLSRRHARTVERSEIGQAKGGGQIPERRGPTTRRCCYRAPASARVAVSMRSSALVRFSSELA